MKRPLLPVLFALLTFAAAAVRAQDDGAPPPPDGGPGMHETQAGKGPDVAKLKERLGLTDDQASKLKQAFEEHKAAVQPVIAQRREAMKKLQEQVKSKASDDEIKGTLAELEKTGDSLRQANEKLRADTKAILTPTQQAKMFLGMAHRMRRRLEMLRGRRGQNGKAEPAGQSDEKAQGDEGGENEQ